MHRDAVHSEVLDTGLRLYIYQDEDAENPRKAWDQLGVMVCAHRRYDLGDRQPTAQEQVALERGGFKLLSRYLKRTEGAVAVLPLGLLDHSGLTMWVGGGAHWSDAQGWDSGTVGFAYITKDKAAEGSPEGPEKTLEQEVAEYDMYLRGDVYGYVIEDEQGEHVDSCWGFYGFDECLAEAKAAA